MPLVGRMGGEDDLQGKGSGFELRPAVIWFRKSKRPKLNRRNDIDTLSACL